MGDDVQEEEALSLPTSGDAAFASLMDFMVTEENGEEAAEGAAPSPEASDDGGLPTPTGEVPGGETAEPERDEAGADREPEVPREGVVTDTQPFDSGVGVGSLDAATLTPKWAEMGEAIETRFQETFTSQALEAVREEHSRYFEMLEKHPRMLVGQEVPALEGEGMETLRDSADAREWQEAVQQILVDEVKSRAQRSLEDEGGTLETVHASIALFADNKDLIPGTKTFNPELANRFASLARDYEMRVDGKLVGYKVPVQGLISSLREQLKKETPAAPAKTAAAAPQAPADPPQAGIASKAGNAGDGPEDFSTLFGTLGLPNLRI